MSARSRRAATSSEESLMAINDVTIRADRTKFAAPSRRPTRKVIVISASALVVASVALAGVVQQLVPRDLATGGERRATSMCRPATTSCVTSSIGDSCPPRHSRRRHRPARTSCVTWSTGDSCPQRPSTIEYDLPNPGRYGRITLRVDGVELRRRGRRGSANWGRPPRPSRRVRTLALDVTRLLVAAPERDRRGVKTFARAARCSAQSSGVRCAPW